MRSKDELLQALGWVAGEVLSCDARYLLLVGHKTFALHREIANACGSQSNLEIIHPAALAYVPRDPTTIIALADEMEYGRTLYEDCAPVGDWGDVAFHLRALYLNGSRSARAHRLRSAEYLTQHNAYDVRFARALKDIKGWRTFSDDGEFHRSGIVALATFLRETLRAPFNADAMLFRVQFHGLTTQQVMHSLSRLGHLANCRRMAATFFPEPCMFHVPNPVARSLGGAKTPRVLFKLYADSDTSILVSPMVFHSLEIAQPWQPLTRGLRWAQEALDEAKALNQSADPECQVLAYHSIVSLAANVDAMCGFLEILSGSPGDAFLDAVHLDEERLRAFYGQQLSPVLVSAVRRRLPRYKPRPVDLQLPVPSWEYQPLVDMGKLLLIKEECHSAFLSRNVSPPDPIVAKRAGLSFEEMRGATGIDHPTLATSVDLLCDLEWTVPFNRCTRAGSGWTIERCYNTTHGDIQGFLVKIIRLSQDYGVNTNITTLNKAAAFLTHTALAPLVRQGNLSGRDVQPRPYLYGKQVSFFIDQEDQQYYLDEYLSLDASKALFEKRGDQFCLREGADIEESERHFSLCDVFVIEGYLEKFLQIHQRIAEIIQQRAIFSIPTGVKAADALAVFVDLLGNEYPEAALGTISVNLHRSAPDVGKLSRKKKQDLLKAMVRKVQILDAFAPGYAQLRLWLEKYPQSAHVVGVLDRFVYYPKGSPILALIRLVVQNTLAAFPRPGARLTQYWDLLQQLSSGQSPARHLPPDLVRELWVVSADMRGSQTVVTRTSGVHWKQHIQSILHVWAAFFGGFHINFRGDEIIAGFERDVDALAFAAAAAVHANEICDACLHGSGYGVGVSHGRLIASRTGGEPSVSVAPSAPFDPIAVASQAAKGHVGIRVCQDPHTTTDLAPGDLFEERVLAPLRALHSLSASTV